MALSVSVSAQGSSSAASATTSAVTTTGGSGTAFVIAASFDPGVTPSSATDSKGNTYTLRASATNASGTGKTAIYVCENGTGGTSHTFTFTGSGTAYPYVFGFEVLGSATSSAFDISVTGTDTATPYTILSGTLAQANEILISSLCGDFCSAAGVSVYAPGTGWTLIQSGSDFNSFWPGAVGYKVVSSTTSDGPSWSIAAGGNASLALISIKESSGAAPSSYDASPGTSRSRPGRGPYQARQFRRPSLDAFANIGPAAALAANVSVVTTATSALTTTPAPVDALFGTVRNRPGRGPYSLRALFRPSMDAQTTVAQAAALASAVQAVTTGTASLSTQIVLAAAAGGQCTLTAALTTGIPIAAAPQGQATLSAALSTGIPLQAAAQAVTTVAATLAGGAAQFAADVQSQTTVAAALSTQIPLQAAAAAQVTVGAALSTQIRLAASGSTQCTVTAALTTGIPLQASAQAVTTIVANLAGGALLAAAAQGQCTVTAALTTGIPLAAAAQCVTTATAALVGNAVALAANITVQAQVSALLSTGIALAAIAQARTTSSAALSTQIRLQAAVQGVTTVGASFEAVVIQGAARTQKIGVSLTRPKASTLRRK